MTVPWPRTSVAVVSRAPVCNTTVGNWPSSLGTCGMSASQPDMVEPSSIFSSPILTRTALPGFRNILWRCEAPSFFCL